MRFVAILIFFYSNLYSVDLKTVQSEINNLVEKTNKAVVSVKVAKEGYASVVEPEFFFGYIIPEEKLYKYKIGGVGSGVIISEDGYVVTNYHVIEDADEVSIETFDDNRKTTYKAVYAGGDKRLDIAILKIKSNRKFNYLSFSQASVKVGDLVFAIGYPFGFKQTYTMGIVSSKNVSLKVEGKVYNDLIQTDAAINRGNSGGPLVNINGEIVGINSAIYSPSGAFAGVGFAIPAWRVREVVDEVIYRKSPQRGWLGISLLPADLIMRKVMLTDIPKGGIINKVYENSPAKKAGLKRGDIITSIDNEDVENDEDLLYKIYYKKPGDKVSISYVRGGKEYVVDVVLGERPKEEEIKNLIASETPGKGDKIYEFNGIILKYSSNTASVIAVKDDSPLKNYLKVGDKIVGVNNMKFGSYKDMVEVFKRVDISEGVLFDMIRDGEPFYLSVQIK